ncbi:MAG: replication-associated recombination protein A [Deltaproteobacteria bacterium]|nr:replication-associated recombination protein A [Deltaproteobacteria bacterium]
MRPRNLDEFAGQQHIVGPGTTLRSAIENDRVFSMILWGPPGCGKTTLARIISNETRSHFVHFSAVLSGVKQIRAVIDEASEKRRIQQKRTLLFVDEIHRFNKAQQDAFLHHVENGLITLIGATTENPSFEVISALMSRCRVFTLERLSNPDLQMVLERALRDPERGLGKLNLTLAPSAMAHLIDLADGDARTALSNLEVTVTFRPASGPDAPAGTTITLADAEQAIQKKALAYDKSGEEHYNIISAFHKSMRGSDPDAALYWLARMIMAGEDPLYIARRMVRFASEDVGNADPRALTVTMDAMEAYRFLGSPEGELALAQAVLYLATAPKSNSAYMAYKKARQAVEKHGALPVPHHIRNAPTGLMKSLGYGKGYQYDPDQKAGVAAQTYFPQNIQDHTYYEPVDRGYEKTIRERMDWWEKVKAD